MKTPAKKIYAWASVKVSSKLAPLWLSLIFLLEQLFFLPLDAILILFALENPKRRYWYALLAATCSTIGGVGGYFLGHLAWEVVSPYVLGHFISVDFFSRICTQYAAYESWAVFIGALLPLPFKVVALSAGVCHLSLWPFISSVLLARIVRFLLVAKAVEKWGAQIKTFLDRHFGRVLLAVGAKVALAFAFFWALGQ